MEHKILYLTPGFAKDESDSTCIPALQDFFLELKTRGVDFEIVTIHYPSKKSYVWNGIKVTSLGLNNAKGFRKIAALRKAQRQLLAYTKQHKITLVHSFWLTDASIVGNYIAEKSKIPHIITAMGQDVSDNKYLHLHKRKSPRIVTLSKVQAGLLHQNGLHSEATIPWGTRNYPSEITERDFDLIGVGSLITLKQYDQFIAVIALVKEHLPSISALIVGEGPERNKLEARIDETGLTQNVSLAGLTSREETLNYFKRSKVFLHPSKYEGFGMVIIEALDAGCHVVSSDTGIAREIEVVNKFQTIEEAAQLIVAKIQEDNVEHKLYPITSTVDDYLRLYSN